MNTDPFLAELIALDRALGGEVPLIVGGGYGLVLRQRHLRAARTPTRRAFPPARSTQDIDLFLQLEVLLNPRRIERFRAALDTLGYRPVEAAKYYQFVRDLEFAGQQRGLKIDLLARLPETADERTALKADARRVRNRSFRLLHAHATPEAVTVEELLLPLTLNQGEERATVYVPHPFSYLLLKLFALRDQTGDPARFHGRHHAYDIFCTVAMMTRADWQGALAHPLLGGTFGDRSARARERLLRQPCGTGGATPGRACGADGSADPGAGDRGIPLGSGGGIRGRAPTRGRPWRLIQGRSGDSFAKRLPRSALRFRANHRLR